MSSADEQRPITWAAPAPGVAPAPAPPGGWPSAADGQPLPTAAPAALRPVAVLLLVNLALSIIVTVLTALRHSSIIEYQLDHRHITDPAIRQAITSSFSYTITTRAVANIVVSVVYAFLLRALFRGRRWAYRRIIILSGAGILGLISLMFTPYPPWMRVEQVLQAIVLATLLYFGTRPAVRAYFDPALPGRNLRRFNR